MDFEDIREYILKKIHNEIDPKFVYHSCTHTRNVVKASEEIATAENLSDENIILVKTAALLHDVGFLDDFRNHEDCSADFAGKILPDFGYSKKDIEVIKKLILATKSPRVPESLMEEIICDADLDYLGRIDFYIHAYKYRLELDKLGVDYTLIQWYQIQYKFLTCHKYYTKTAKRTRDKMRKQHIAEIAALLNSKKDK